MIRKGRVEDIPKIFTIGEELRGHYYRQDVPIHRPTAFKVINEFIRSPEQILLVADNGKEFTGLTMMSVETYWECDPKRGRRYASDWIFLARKFGDARKMLRIAVEWAWSMPRVIEVRMGTQISARTKVVDRLFLGEGFERCGFMYRCHKPQE